MSVSVPFGWLSRTVVPPPFSAPPARMVSVPPPVWEIPDPLAATCPVEATVMSSAWVTLYADVDGWLALVAPTLPPAAIATLPPPRVPIPVNPVSVGTGESCVSVPLWLNGSANVPKLTHQAVLCPDELPP